MKKENAVSNNFFTNFKFKVKSNFKIMIIILILHMISAPLLLLNGLIYYVSNRTSDFNSIYVVIAVIATGLAVLAGIIVAQSMFSHLYKKQEVDMTLSLPLTTNQRFFSDFLAGLFIYVGPFLASTVVTFLINGLGNLISSDWRNEVIMTEGAVTGITSLLAYLTIAGILIMIMLYTLTVLVANCCGSFFESAAYSVLVNGLIPATIAVFGVFFLGNLYGMTAEDAILPVIMATSPIGGVIKICTWLSSNNSTWDFFKWLIEFVIVIGIFFGGAYFLNKYRKAEQVSKPFVYKAFYYVMITCITFCISMLFLMNDLDGLRYNIIPLIIITGIVYLIFEVITNRGFKKFWKSVIRYGITLGAVVILTLAFQSTDGFGAVVKVPKLDSIKSVELSYNGIFRGNGSSYYNGNREKNLVYKDKENIAAIRELHNEIIEEYKRTGRDKDKYISHDESMTTSEGKMRGDGHFYIEIRYNLGAGVKQVRTYSGDNGKYIDILKKIDASDEFKSNFVEKQREIFKRFTLNKTKAEIRENSANPRIYMGNQSKPINANDAFFDALKEDLLAISDEEYFMPTKQMLYRIKFRNGESIVINENYPNVLAFIRGTNVKIDKGVYQKYCEELVSLSRLDIIKAEDISEGYVMAGDNSFLRGTSGITVSRYSPAVQRMIDAAQPQYITEDRCTMINIDGEAYVIPLASQNLVDEVLKESGESLDTIDMSKIYSPDNMVEGEPYGYVIDDTGKEWSFENYGEFTMTIKTLYRDYHMVQSGIINDEVVETPMQIGFLRDELNTEYFYLDASGKGNAQKYIESKKMQVQSINNLAENARYGKDLDGQAAAIQKEYPAEVEPDAA